jgi:glutamyl-tRNA synthetase
VPLVLTPGGERLAKRTRPVSIGELRRRGVDPRAIVGALGASAGLCAPGARVAPADLITGFDVARVPPQPATIDPAMFD